MSHLCRYFLPVAILAGGPALGAEPLRGLPGPVKTYAVQFDQECRSSGLGSVITNENYTEFEHQSLDVNGDRQPDYLVYKCMFGCSEKPTALTGIGTPCPWGNLLLSGEDGYKALFLPGMVTQILPGTPVRAIVTRPRTLRVLGNFCEDGYGDHDPQHVYELKDGRFQSKGMCPEGGCSILLSELGVAPTP